MAHGCRQSATPTTDRLFLTDGTPRSGNKRPRMYISPPGQAMDEPHCASPSHRVGQDNKSSTRTSFPPPPPIVVKFKSAQNASIKNITNELTTSWNQRHGEQLAITARFGHLQSLLIFAEDTPSFESLLDTIRWPITLNEIDIEVRTPRQLPSEYSLVIQQFHPNWIEDEWQDGIKKRYNTLSKITRLRVKDGSPLNAVRVEFRSIKEVKSIIKMGKIYVGSMVYPVKPYHRPVRINKCLKCLRHDHATKDCTHPRLCPRCATEHHLEHRCQREVKCVNCGGSHMSGSSACPVVQEKRRALLEHAKNQRAEVMVLAERRAQPYTNRGQGFSSQSTSRANPSAIDTPKMPHNPMARQYAHVVKKGPTQDLQRNIDETLSAFLDKMERRLDPFSSRLS